MHAQEERFIACCLFRTRGNSQRLEELADALRLAFSTGQPGQGGGPPASAGYKVHVHREKRRGAAPLPPEHELLPCRLKHMQHLIVARGCMISVACLAIKIQLLLSVQPQLMTTHRDSLQSATPQSIVDHK